MYEKILQTMKEAKKTEVIIGIEPTGHYWMNLAYFLDQYGIPLVIARLLKDGRFSYPRILKDIEAELRIGSTLRSKLTEDLASIKNRIIRWLDRYFPEFSSFF
ncbi:transposase [Lysinibacillus sp. RC79]